MFREIAERNIRLFRRYRAIVTTSSCCAYTLRVLYPNTGIAPVPDVKMVLDVVHPIARRMKSPVRKKKNLPSRIVYHGA
jgi:Fe-S oxidoreductase